MIATLSVLAALGVNIVPLLAGASIVGVAVGFGSQSLVRDIVCGAFFLMGLAISLWLTVDKVFGSGEALRDRPLLLLGSLLLVLGIQTLSIGLLGEIIIFTHARKLKDYTVDREL